MRHARVPLPRLVLTGGRPILMLPTEPYPYFRTGPFALNAPALPRLVRYGRSLVDAALDARLPLAFALLLSRGDRRISFDGTLQPALRFEATLLNEHGAAWPKEWLALERNVAAQLEEHGRCILLAPDEPLRARFKTMKAMLDLAWGVQRDHPLRCAWLV
jgi:hypothetical protein